MHLLKNNKIIYFYLVSFLFLTTIFNKNLDNIYKNVFLIKDIKINLETSEIKDEIYLKTKYLINTNILNINKKKLHKELKKLNFLENIKIKKNYPSTIIIDTKKTKLIAVTYKNQQKYYLGSNGKFILSKNLKNNQNLPVIFGNFNVSDYFELNEILKEEDINANNIIKYYYHKNKRWDLYLSDNIIIKLPNKNVKRAISLYKIFKNSNTIKNNTIIDLRISNRLVLKNEQK